jgi:DhnA family fructose-bisphosphate aldolase class Ia
MEIGKQRRMQRIFKADGRTLIVAMDHAAYMPDVVLGLEDPGKYIQEIHEAGADAL